MSQEKEPFGLKQETISKILNVIRSYPEVESVILYGSRAKGTYKKSSDIDLTLKGKNVDSTLVFKIENELDDLLLPYMIDLSAFNEIDNPDLIEHIQRIGIEFTGSI